jgi:3'-phosphoadenosine 5'-phosphosulfate sulfotransferase (PAPS reductase)/FAD synthetase
MHIIMFSGGVGSFMAAKRVVEEYGAESTILLFTDTKTEDEDLYRFVTETTTYLKSKLVSLSDGRDVWEVFKDVKFLGNSRIAPCTRILKQTLARKWIEANYDPEDVRLYVGIDWSEEHRLEKIKENWKPYKIFAPLTDKPYLSKEDIFRVLKKIGIRRPRLYDMGFSHNNCGGFCCKAGQGHFANLLQQMPERYAYHEKKEEEMRKYLGRDIAILKRQKDNRSFPYTLKQLREDIELKDKQIDLLDIGGCGCFIEESRCEYNVSNNSLISKFKFLVS